jgi:hypothetical protein
VSDEGWQYDSYTVPANQKFKITISEYPEASTTPDVETYVKAISALSDLSVKLEPRFSYDYSGECVSVKKGKYNATTTTIKPTIPTGAGYQGFGFFNGTLMQFYVTSSATYLMLIDYDTASTISTIDATSVGHGNAIGFFDSYYDESDDYPTAIVSDTTGSPIAYHVRITSSAITVLNTISLPVAQAGYFANVMVDSLNNILYTVGYTEASYSDNTSGQNYMIFAKWDWNDLTINNDTTVTPRFIESFTTPFMQTMQGSAFHNGKMFVVSSASSNSDTLVYVVDPTGQRISNVLKDFPTAVKTTEVEGICFVEDDGDVFAIMKTNSNGHPYYKVEFNS